MQKKPLFRPFDQCWYAYAQAGTKRQQVKLRDRDGEPIRSPEREGDAFQAFCRLMADVPDAIRLTVRKICDLFLDHSQGHNDAATYEWYRCTCNLFATTTAVQRAQGEADPRQSLARRSRGLEIERRCAVVSIKRPTNGGSPTEPSTRIRSSE